MYAYDFKSEYNGIRHSEIFVVMPFDAKFDAIFQDLIVPATKEANNILNLHPELQLQSYRTKYDMRTTSGWINILEHLTTARIVLGVLTDNNPNVFYKLGIAHATQTKTRQILIANQGYKPKFDTKDLIYYLYDDNNLSGNVPSLAKWIVDAYQTYKIEEEIRVKRARMKLSPSEFMIIIKKAQKRNFSLEFQDKDWSDYIGQYGSGTYAFLIMGMRNLCHDGLLGLNTKSRSENSGVNIESSYYWTNLGNDVLCSLKLINENELQRRRIELPSYMNKIEIF